MVLLRSQSEMRNDVLERLELTGGFRGRWSALSYPSYPPICSLAETASRASRPWSAGQHPSLWAGRPLPLHTVG